MLSPPNTNHLTLCLIQSPIGGEPIGSFETENIRAKNLGSEIVVRTENPALAEAGNFEKSKISTKFVEVSS